MENKNKLTIIALIIIVLIIIVMIIVNKRNTTSDPAPVTQSEIELNNAIENDDINSIKESLDNINIEDTTDADLKIIDEEVEKL